jgi:nucleoid DNA-binding protein
VKQRNQRLARNPRTGEQITVAARKQLVFKAAK